MNENLIIDALGGTADVARLCNVKPPSVSEWRRNGIPPARLMYLRLLRPDVFNDECTEQDPVNAESIRSDERRADREPSRVMAEHRSAVRRKEAA